MHNLIPAMEKYYGQQFGSYSPVPSLTIRAGMVFGNQREGKKYCSTCSAPHSTRVLATSGACAN